jgi:hypothetical protein
MPGVGDRRHGGGPLPADLDPPLDQCLVGAGGNAQLGDLLVPGGVGPAFAEAERRARALGQQARPPGRGFGQFGDRHGFLVCGEPPALSVPGGGSRDLGIAESIRVGAVHLGMIEYVFELRQGHRAWSQRRMA